MQAKLSFYRGCLLGLAAGDAMGYAVDDSTLAQIQEDYGPDGILGYDMVNGYADPSSHTQLAAYACNGLLLGLTRGQTQGMMAPFVRYIALSEREWARTQRYSGNAERIFCWITRERDLKGRRCMDTRMLDALNQQQLGSMEEPANRFVTPGALTTAVAVGMFGRPRWITREECNRLGAEAVALTHGAPQTFLSGAVIAHMISRILVDGADNIREVTREAVAALQEQFGREYRQTVEVKEALNMALSLSGSRHVSRRQAMEQLRCTTAPEVLAGAVYAAATHPNNFDEGLICAVNHSGRSAAVGALTGAILGARLGEENIPEFYLEPLTPAELLRELAGDMFQGCPMDQSARMFDDDWDRKYVHGGQG